MQVLTSCAHRRCLVAGAVVVVTTLFVLVAKFTQFMILFSELSQRNIFSCRSVSRHKLLFCQHIHQLKNDRGFGCFLFRFLISI